MLVLFEELSLDLMMVFGKPWKNCLLCWLLPVVSVMGSSDIVLREAFIIITIISCKSLLRMEKGTIKMWN